MIELTEPRFTRVKLVGIIKDRSKIASAKECLLWTNNYVK